MADPLRFVDLLVEAGALRFGDFTLKSGDRSPFFVNLGDVATGRSLQALGDLLAEALHDRFPGATHLFGPAYKGIVLATAAATAAWARYGWDLAVCYDRKEAKAHGEGGALVGRLPGPGDRVVVVDDVYSSGGTKVQAVGLLRGYTGTAPLGILVGVDRRRAGVAFDPGLPEVRSLCDLGHLEAWLAARGDPRAAAVARFRDNLPLDLENTP